LLHSVGATLTGVYLVLMTLSNLLAIGIGWLADAGVRSFATRNATRDAVERVHGAIVSGFAVYATIMLGVMLMAGLAAGEWWLVGAMPDAIIQARNACLLLGLYVWIAYVHNADLTLFTGLLR